MDNVKAFITHKDRCFDLCISPLDRHFLGCLRRRFHQDVRLLHMRTLTPKLLGCHALSEEWREDRSLMRGGGRLVDFSMRLMLCFSVPCFFSPVLCLFFFPVLAFPLCLSFRSRICHFSPPFCSLSLFPLLSTSLLSICLCCVFLPSSLFRARLPS